MQELRSLMTVWTWISKSHDEVPTVGMLLIALASIIIIYVYAQN